MKYGSATWSGVIFLFWRVLVEFSGLFLHTLVVCSRLVVFGSLLTVFDGFQSFSIKFLKQFTFNSKQPRSNFSISKVFQLLLIYDLRTYVT